MDKDIKSQREIHSSTHTTVDAAGATAQDWSAYFNSWGGNYNNTAKKPAKTENASCACTDEDKCTCEAEFITNMKYNMFVEEHICPEPEQCMCNPKDFIEAASAGCECFNSVQGEMPDAPESVRPEADAVYTAEEKVAIKKAVAKKTTTKTTKKAAGRPRKTTTK